MVPIEESLGCCQVLEWQQRLEDLRIRDLRSRRNAEHWAKEVDHLRELTRSQALKVDQLEEEMVRLENQMEQRQLDWETREVELETLEDEADKARSGEGRAGKHKDGSRLALPGNLASVWWWLPLSIAIDPLNAVDFKSIR